MPPTTLTRPEPTTAVRPRPSAAAAAAAGLVALYALVVLWTPGRLLDQALLAGSRRLVGDEVVRAAADALLGVLSPISVGLVLVALLGIAALRGRWRAGVTAVAAVPLALVVAEVLKLVVLGGGVDQDVSLLPGTGSFPSGHVTVVAAVALAGARVTARRWRSPIRLLAAAVTAVVGVAVVLAGWHRPGDVVAGVLVAVLAHEVVGRFGRRDALREGRSTTTTGVTT